MTFKQVRHFLAIAKERTFVRATRQCGISQPSVTNSIKSLEAAFGGSLFVRTAARAELTVFGRQMYPLLARLHRNKLQILEMARNTPTKLTANGKMLTVKMVAILLEHAGEPRPGTCPGIARSSLAIGQPL
jgi:DNA-binding transcriptional LysR family regulator